MKYLLDTNICVFLIRKKSAQALRKLSQYSVVDVAVSSITTAELQYGVQRSSDVLKNQQALDHFLAPLIIFSFDYQASVVYGRIRAYLEAKGTPIGSLDTLIAAQALSEGLTLVTNNTREFVRVPDLVVEDWTIA